MRRIIGATVGLIAFVCVGCLFVGVLQSAFGGGDPTPTRAIAAAATATPTPRATLTPRPTVKPTSCSTDLPVKTTVLSDGQRVYYTPDQPGYDQAAWESCLADTATAERNGYTRATAPPSVVPQAPPTATLPPATALPPTVAPTSPPVVAFRSGGLGKTRAEWEATYREPEDETVGMFTYANGNYRVMFSEGRVGHIEHSWGDQNKKSRAFADGATRPLIPNDAQLIEEYKSPRSGSTVVRYRSNSLAAILPAAAFTGGEPGDFIIIYRDTTGQITSYIIALGNNP